MSTVETNVIEEKYDQQPLGVSGLGGWLVVVQIGIYLTMVLLVLQFFQVTIPAFDMWDVLTSQDSAFYHPMWGTLLTLETAYNAVFLLFCVYILINFYQKKSRLPRLMIIFYSVSLLVSIIDTVLIYQIPLAREADQGSSIRDIVKSLVTCVIWVSYFIKSERVQNTFRR